MPQACDNFDLTISTKKTEVVHQPAHYVNISMQYTAIFQCCKNDNFRLNFFDYVHFFCSNRRLWVHVRIASVGRF